MPPTSSIDQVKRDEGEKLVVYLDSEGIRTAGVGHNLEAHGIGLQVGETITQQQSDEWLASDIAEVQKALAVHLPWTHENLDIIRRAVLENMAFNMGINGLIGFHRTLTMIESGNYSGASDAMLESKWAKQVGDRAHRLSEQMRNGVWV